MHILRTKNIGRNGFLAELIIEMIDRLDFGSIQCLYLVLFLKEAPYKEVMCFAEVRDEKNERMSKTKPNYVKFDDAADKMGSDILRWNYSTASIGSNMRFGWGTLEDVRRRFYIQLWNSYNYFVTYAKLHDWDWKKYDVKKLTHLMDKWMVAKDK